MKKLDDTGAIEVAKGIWWVGFADYEAGFSNNPYLMVDEDECVLFDPGPGHPMFRDLVLQKIDQITNPEKIRYIIVHHQDPDLCGLIPFIENSLHPDLVLMSHPRTALFLPYYGVRKGILPLGDGDVLEMKSGRRIAFHHAPYLHFAGNMMSYDEQTGSLFSGDIFAVFSREWSLYADESYIELARNFLEHYVDSKESLRYAYDKIKNLKIERILPQHGGIIEGNVDRFLEVLKDAEPGELLKDLANQPSAEQVEEFVSTGRDWLKGWLKRDVNANSMDDLMKIALGEGPSTVSLLIDNITEKAKEFNVANPLTNRQIHRWDNIWSAQTSQIFDSIRRRFLTRQYGLRHGSKSNIEDVLQQGLQAFKSNVAVMFIDIRGFTNWSATKTPEAVVRTLNAEHEVITRIVNASGGRVNKIMGDGLLVYFPEYKLLDCISAATKLQKAIKDHGLLPIGVGCDCGEVIMGDLGQEARLDYTLIGSVVNFASRMCDSAGGGEIAVSKRLFEKVDAALKEELVSQYSLTEVKVKMKPSDPEREGVLLRPMLHPSEKPSKPASREPAM